MINSERSKLVRDKIPDLMRKQGKIPTHYSLVNGDFYRELVDQLFDAASAMRNAGADRKKITEALAEIREVIHAAARAWNIPWQEVKEKQKVIRKELGGYEKRVYLLHNPKMKSIRQEE